MSDEERTLTKNRITLFIIKVDLTPDSTINFADLANNLSELFHFDRIERRGRTNFTVNVTGGDVKTEAQAVEDIVLVKAGSLMTLTLSSSPNCIISLVCRKYENNTEYRSLFDSIVVYLGCTESTVRAQRIGMRFVNEFPCSNFKEINKIFESQRAKSISTMVNNDGISRVIAQEEYNLNGSKLRVQYGIPNKFYPAVLNNSDLLLDIDAYDDSSQSFQSWIDVLQILNRHAYEAFVKYINPKYLAESLR